MFSKLGQTDIRSSGFQAFWGGARFFLFWPLVVTRLWEPFQWFLKNLKCRGFMVQMENYSSVLKASPYAWGPEKQKGKVIFPKPHSRHNQAENLPFPSAPSSLWLISWCYWLWCSLGTSLEQITRYLWAMGSLTLLNWWPAGQGGNSPANPRAQAGATKNCWPLVSAIASGDERFPLWGTDAETEWSYFTVMELF